MSIVEFLLARIEEDEALARSASPGPWHVDAESTEVLAVDGIVVADGFALSGPQTRATTAHIARHDPTRVLAECAAKRQTVAYFAEEIEYTGLDRQRMTDDQFRRVLDAERTLGWLAQPYADHPDFDPAWRP